MNERFVGRIDYILNFKEDLIGWEVFCNNFLRGVLRRFAPRAVRTMV